MTNNIQIEGHDYQMRLAEAKELPALRMEFTDLSDVACSVFVLSREGKNVGVVEIESLVNIRQIWMKQNQGAAVRTHFTALALFFQDMSKRSGASIVGFVFKRKKAIQRIFESFGAKKFRPSKGRFYSYPEKVF